MFDQTFFFLFFQANIIDIKETVIIIKILKKIFFILLQGNIKIILKINKAKDVRSPLNTVINDTAKNINTNVVELILKLNFSMEK